MVPVLSVEPAGLVVLQTAARACVGIDKDAGEISVGEAMAGVDAVEIQGIAIIALVAGEAGTEVALDFLLDAQDVRWMPRGRCEHICAKGT